MHIVGYIQDSQIFRKLQTPIVFHNGHFNDIDLICVKCSKQYFLFQNVLLKFSNTKLSLIYFKKQNPSCFSQKPPTPNL